jgi:hypothetical protein
MPIEFFETDDSLPQVDAFVFDVPCDLSTKAEVFTAFGEGLMAPNGYFGTNWDAFNDCLMDLQWITVREISLIHSELPKLTENELGIYLQVLVSASSEWEGEKTDALAAQFEEFVPHRLKVCFPACYKASISSVLTT